MVREECKKNMIYHVFHAFKAMKFWRERKKSELRKKRADVCYVRDFAKSSKINFFTNICSFFIFLTEIASYFVMKKVL